ncbi:MAG: NnrS family protein, partial [Planctomycetes bacterium]|nr:NnrS family protein [Planctomycetota bacterium]
MIHPEETIPRLLARAPHLRPVLDRYGLRGCGGATGPDETLAFFAAAHGVELDRLLRELNAAPAKAPPAPSAPGLTDALYRPFFLGGLAFALVPGVILGLYVMGRAWAGGSLVSPPINLINAHAHAMVAGFAGMFIMGFGYQALPRFKHASLWRPKLALFSFVLMALGVSARVAGEMLALDMSGPVFSFGGPWLALALAGSGLETVALALFALILWRTCAVAGAGWAAYDRYVFAAAGWLVLGSLAAGVHLAAITTADGFGTLIPRIAALQEPLRMVQLLGGATILILGVMQRFLPPVCGFADPGQRAMKFWFWPLNLGLAVMVTGFGWSMAAKRGLAAAPLSVATLQTMYWLALLVFAVSVLGVLTGFRPWRTPAGRDRSIPFVRAAHGWL